MAVNKGRKIGQAPALSSTLWKAWLQWMLEHAGARVYTVLMLTGAFGLRCSEALALRREDIMLEGDIPKVRVAGRVPGSRKSPGDVYIRQRHFQSLKTIAEKGVHVKRTRGHKLGKATIHDSYSFPKQGYLFKSRRRAAAGHMSYHAIYVHVRREAPKFLTHLKTNKQKWEADIAKLRPHSGRATLITELMGEGMSTALSMKYARHAPGSVKVHLAYGRLTLRDVKRVCDRLEDVQPTRKRKWADMSTQQLLQCQKAICKELETRHAQK